ncbi:MAG: hypothetical protein IH895_10665 [Planctomycetes bacterium]|nr:hypothetical protein [Planctomycetota bacterium]
MKIERAWLRIVVSVVVGGIAVGLFLGGSMVLFPGGVATWYLAALFFILAFLVGPIIATVLAHILTPKEWLDGETRCRKCGYILKGLTEPRCSECGERI